MGSACTSPALRWLLKFDLAGCTRLQCTPCSLVVGPGMRIFCVSRLLPLSPENLHKSSERLEEVSREPSPAAVKPSGWGYAVRWQMILALPMITRNLGKARFFGPPLIEIMRRGEIAVSPRHMRQPLRIR